MDLTFNERESALRDELCTWPPDNASAEELAGTAA